MPHIIMKPESKKFLLICFLALATLFTPLLFGQNLFLTIALLTGISLAMLSVDWSYKNFVFYLAIFITGPVAEMTAIYFGAWIYTDPIFLGIPLWLPFVWGNAGLYIVRLHKYIFSKS